MKSEKKSKAFWFICAIFLFVVAQAQQPTIPVADNLVTDGIPPLPAAIIPEVKSYTESRGAVIVDWHPLKKEMLIATRFGNTPQLHWVKMPGGDRKQITFFDEPVANATFNPVNANYFLYAKDSGGNEFGQIYRYEISTGKSIQLTPGGRSQNGNIAWNEKGNKIVYSSTRRNGADRDIYMMDPLDTSTNKMLMQVSGGGWGIDDWSDDEKKLIVEEGISVNESRLWIYDFNTGEKKRLLPQQDERVVYSNGVFSKDGKGIYLLSNKDNEFLS
jgi:Tol biopolymer transport system component